MTRGSFITFEGGEGTGKTTQLAKLAASLTSRGIEVVATREPGGSAKAERLRAVLLSGQAKRFGPFAEAILFAAARDDHLTATIRPALAAGRWVLCDRFADSTRVYQGVLGNLDPRLVRALEAVIVGQTRPDLTFILDLPAAEGLKRAAARGGAADRFESEDPAYHEKLRQAFLTLAKAEPERCHVIDASGDPEDIAAEILKIVSAKLPLPVAHLS